MLQCNMVRVMVGVLIGDIFNYLYQGKWLKPPLPVAFGSSLFGVSLDQGKYNTNTTRYSFFSFFKTRKVSP